MKWSNRDDDDDGDEGIRHITSHHTTNQEIQRWSHDVVDNDCELSWLMIEDFQQHIFLAHHYHECLLLAYIIAKR